MKIDTSGVNTVGINKKAMAEYIKNQLQEDIANNQMSIKDYKNKMIKIFL